MICFLSKRNEFSDPIIEFENDCSISDHQTSFLMTAIRQKNPYLFIYK